MQVEFRAVVRRFADVNRAITFYRDGMGLTPGPAVENQMMEFSFPNGSIFEVAAGDVRPAEPVNDRRQAHDTPIFDVDDVDAMVERLVGFGATIINPPFDLPRRRLAYLADPEGHIIGLGKTRVMRDE